MNLNKVIIMGNLTRDPEIRALPSGTQVANIGIATNRFWVDRNGQKQKEAEFHNVVAFGKTAEIAKQYLTKGGSVFIEGRLKTRDWQGQDGVKRYKTEIVAERLQLGPRSNFAGGSAQNSSYTNSNNSQNDNVNQTGKTENLDIIEYPEEEDINLEDIPF